MSDRVTPGSKVTTHKKRFVHVRREDGNTVCGAHPSYYTHDALVELSDEEAQDMHHCKRCFPLCSECGGTGWVGDVLAGMPVSIGCGLCNGAGRHPRG